MPRRLTVSLVVAVLIATSTHAGGMWDKVQEALDAQKFCKTNPSAEKCQPTTAAQLLPRCDSGPDSEERAYCYGALAAMAARARSLPEWRCVPQAVFRHPEQFRALFAREAHRMPELLHRPAEDLMGYAVAKAFPCPRSPLLAPRNSN